MESKVGELEKQKKHEGIIKEITVLWHYKLLILIMFGISFCIALDCIISIEDFNNSAIIIMHSSASMLFAGLAILIYGLMVRNNKEYYYIIGNDWGLWEHEKIDASVIYSMWIGVIVIVISILLFIISPIFVVIT